MKCEQVGGRTLLFSNLDDTQSILGYSLVMESVEVTLNYTNDDSGQRVQKAILLDSIIIPAIIKALNTEQHNADT